MLREREVALKLCSGRWYQGVRPPLQLERAATTGPTGIRSRGPRQPLRRLLQHGVIPGSSHNKALGISSPGTDKAPTSWGLCKDGGPRSERYVGLDVSLKLTAICVVDGTGKIVREGAVTSNPEAIAAFIKSHAPHVTRIGLETGATSTRLWTD